MRALFNVKLAKRVLAPLARLRERDGERETGMASFIIRGGTFVMPVMLLLFFFVPLRAEAAASLDVRQLMQSMAQVKEARGKFVERKFLSVLDQPLESSGTLLFQAPGHLEKHTLAPKVESLVLDQGVLTIDSKARNVKRTLVLQEYPVVWAFVESIRSTLAGDLATLERFYNIELEGSAARWKMRLLPIEPKTREVMSEIRISGRGDRVDSIETLESSGDHALMKIVEDAP